MALPDPSATPSSPSSDNGLLNKIANFGKNVFSAFSGPSSQQMGPKGPFYQIKASDVTGGMIGVAKSQGVDHGALMAANPGYNTLSKGDYIAMPGQPKSSTGPTGYNGNINNINQKNSSAINPALGGTTPSVGQMGTTGAAVPNNPTGQALINELTVLRYQLTYGTALPTQLSAVAAQTLGKSDQTMQAAGYVKDSTGTRWVLGSGGSVNTPQGPNMYTNAAGGRGNRGGGAVRNSKGTLVNGGKRGRSAPPPPPPVASNAGTTAEDVLASNMGSG